METLLTFTAVLGLALLAAIISNINRLEKSMATILEQLDAVKLQQQAQGEKLVILDAALEKVQADETNLLGQIEVLQAALAELDTAQIAAKINELAVIAQANLDTLSSAAAKAQAIDVRVPEIPDPA